MEKVIVTGGAGFIGSHLVELLLSKNYHVTVLDDFSNGQRENVDLFNANSNFEFHQVNIAEPFDDSLFADVTYVFHLAALADIVPSVEQPMKYHHANVNGTLRVLEAARKRNVKKFIYTASSSCK